MSKNILDNLFNSKARVKILKFLFRNYPNDFTINELAKHIQESYQVARQEVAVLREIGLIKKKR